MLGSRKLPTMHPYVGYSSKPRVVNDPHGGSALYVHSSISHTVIRLRTRLQAVAVRMYSDRHYSVCSLYLPPGETVSLSSILGLLAQLPRPYLVLGDFNARHTHWGDSVNNTRGNLFMQVLSNYDVSLLNDGSFTAYHTQTNSHTCIDLSLCSSDCVVDFNWRVDRDLRGSDHYPVILEAVSGASIPSTGTKWNTKKADWPRYKGLTKLRDAFPPEDVDEAVLFFKRHVDRAANSSMPLMGGKTPRKSVPWWNDECSRAVINFKEANRRYQRCSSLVNRVDRNRARAARQRTLRQARKVSLRGYISSINSKTPIAKVWKRIRKFMRKSSAFTVPNLTEAGELIGDRSAIAEKFALFYADVSSPRSYSIEFQRLRLREEGREIDFFQSYDAQESYNSLFKVHELRSALKQCRPTAPGPDGITYRMLEEMHPSMLVYLLDIYNIVWITGQFPSTWRESIVLPFRKPNKDGTLPAHYRPIALTCCPCKVFERMVTGRLTWFLETNNLLSPSQVGFRKKQCTTDLLILMETKIREAFAKGHHAVAVFFDIEKAYDTTWRHGVLRQLHTWGLRGNLPRLVQQFLLQRSIRVKIGEELSNPVPQVEGLPQGSVLSVVCFSVAINSIVDGVAPEVSRTLYVDDLALVVSSARLPFALRKMQQAINKVVSNANDRGFRFSASKTVPVHFHRLRYVTWNQPSLSLYGIPLTFESEKWFLGLLFDSKLSWIPHIKTLKMSCLKAMDILKFLSHTTWGSDRRTLWQLYNALVQSKLDYGCQAYSSATDTVLKSLDPVRNLGLRLASGAFKSSPVPSLYAENGVLPLKHHRLQCNLQYLTRLWQNPSTLAHACTFEAQNAATFDRRPSMARPFGPRMGDHHQCLAGHSVLPFGISYCPPWLFPKTSVCAGFRVLPKDQYHPLVLRHKYLEHLHSHSPGTSVYTDGSKSVDGVGAAAVVPGQEVIRVRMPAASSIFTAELTAILAALHFISFNAPGRYTIMCDSRSVLDSLQAADLTHHLVLKILVWLLLLEDSSFSILFCWVPSHVGVPGNEMADRAAKDASELGQVEGSPLPPRDLYPLIRRYVWDRWQSEWDGIPPTKLHAIKPSVLPWPASSRTRHQEVALCRLRIGHTRLTHGHLMAGEDAAPQCLLCQVPVTVPHVLVECPLHSQRRRQAFPFINGLTVPEALRAILSEHSAYFNPQALFNFLEVTHMLSSL